MKRKQEKELNEFEGLFFAFNNEQFREGMEKIGLTADDTSKIYSLPWGGYILKTKSKAFHEMFKRSSVEMEKALEGEEFLREALTYELCNHEFCITGDPQEALDTLGLTREKLQALSFGTKVLHQATAQAMCVS
ncbi:MAG: hypothetical protein U9R01_02255 [candidate division WOR-3 bacterium]|nr:hypothetical protein [candidate division WOR-3 bacterium]